MTKRTALAVAMLIGLSSCGAGEGAAPAAPAAHATASPTITPTATPAISAAAPATATPTATATPSSPSPPTPVPCTTGSVLATWSVTSLAEQTVVIPVNETDVSSVASEVAAGAGGVILFGSTAPANLGAGLQRLATVAPNRVPPLVMTDEEGGDVQRMANLVGSVPSAREMGATMTPSQIGRLATAVARRMRAAWVTMDLAPVLDVDGGQGPNDRNPDGTRSFSADRAIAAADGLAFAAGLQTGGVVPVVKHFPGLGGSTGNTDVTPASTPPWSTLKGVGLVPFEAAVTANAPAMMVANASVTGLTDRPASISSAAITGVLRDQLGYQGLVMTDSLSAMALRAIGYSVPAAAVAAVQAGADMVLYNSDPATVAALTTATVSALVAAVAAGTLARDRVVSAVTRILAVKGIDLCATQGGA
jgi:beta-N-acetylhexosaminidase